MNTETREKNLKTSGRHDLQYVRTDRNGTKIYHDWNCPRCGGYGESTMWTYTGGTCWKCGGTGKRPKPQVVKIYTEEYEAKLEAKRAARAATKEAATPKPSEEELRQRAREARQRAWKQQGFSEEGTGYIYTGNTYPNKEDIKTIKGARFIYGAWIAPERIDGLDGVDITQISAEEYTDHYGSIEPEKFWELLENLKG